VIGAEGATVAAIAGFDSYVITDLAAAPEGNRVHRGCPCGAPTTNTMLVWSA
jgi:hypothetical protein